jgi:2,3-bisphosphoglycerate-dependent phosphoglycerate mutase
MMDRLLVLARHGQSEWNLKNLFTGWKDVALTEVGIAEARAAGRKLKAQGLAFDIGFTSALKRAQDTMTLMLEEMGLSGIPVIKDAALNERDYGELMGINKDEARRRWGAEQVHLWQRSYDIAPPGGESLKDTAQRVVPFFEKRIAPELRSGKNVIVVAHGNSLRALIMQLDRLLPEDVERVELRTGHPLIYRLNADGSIAEKRDIAA